MKCWLHGGRDFFLHSMLTTARVIRAITERAHCCGPACRWFVRASAWESSCCRSRARKTVRTGREKRLLHRSRMSKTQLQRMKFSPDRDDTVILAASSMKTTTGPTLARDCFDALLLHRSIKDGNWFENCLLLADTSTGESYLSAL